VEEPGQVVIVPPEQPPKVLQAEKGLDLLFGGHLDPVVVSPDLLSHLNKKNEIIICLKIDQCNYHFSQIDQMAGDDSIDPLHDLPDNVLGVEEVETVDRSQGISGFPNHATRSGDDVLPGLQRKVYIVHST
jgi:hypothetical protein